MTVVGLLCPAFSALKLNGASEANRHPAENIAQASAANTPTVAAGARRLLTKGRAVSRVPANVAANAVSNPAPPVREFKPPCTGPTRAPETAEPEPSGEQAPYVFALSPTGDEIALVKGNDAKLTVLSLKDQSTRDVLVKHAKNLTKLYRDADGKGWVSTAREGTTYTIMHIDRLGNASPLWSSNHRFPATLSC